MFEKLQKLIASDGEDIWTDFYQAMKSGGYIDSKYLEHTSGQNISEALQKVESMSIEEVCAWLTWILRGERFCEGLFKSSIENGQLSSLLKRGVELTQKGMEEECRR